MTGSQDDDRAKADRLWQRRVLPLMIAVIAGFGVFFAVVSVYQFGQLEHWLTAERPDVTSSLAQLNAPANASVDDQLRLATTRAAIILEQRALDRRHDEAAAVIAVRAWSRFMGFLTGMILSLVGASFVLGKLKEDPSNFGASGGGWAVSAASSSPGLILAMTGAALMIVAIIISSPYDVEDRPTYFPTPQVVVPEDTSAVDNNIASAPAPKKLDQGDP